MEEVLEWETKYWPGGNWEEQAKEISSAPVCHMDPGDSEHRYGGVVRVEDPKHDVDHFDSEGHF
ncbi:predicted protein [Uncinocarpus reesii 1704]|uniref:Uncharacterized protein n=1 Tax=Uncinocarpus reesii (strain UAMH 1704) TaxID=336963 RepID=C4JXP7_UNCRE|nr:uncharacterized protein UREG_06420 [Uncinocarpus reesii 1704]EEP81555.1 predicted protein [Uncinocarpus reesii 1704]